MSSQITLTLPDYVIDRAEALAKLTDRNVEEILSANLESSLPEVNQTLGGTRPVGELSDADVIALTNLQMDEEQDQRYSLLLEKQREGDISTFERIELDALFRIYQHGLLRKSEGLVEAVRRGLIEPQQ